MNMLRRHWIKLKRISGITGDKEDSMTKNKLRRKNNMKHTQRDLIVRSLQHSSYMSHRKVRKLFRQWLKANMHRFKYQPYSINRQHTMFRFQGIDKHIILVMDYRRPEAMIFYQSPDDPKYNRPVAK